MVGLSAGLAFVESGGRETRTQLDVGMDQWYSFSIPLRHP